MGAACGQSAFANPGLSATPIAAFREGANGRPVNVTGPGPFPEGCLRVHVIAPCAVRFPFPRRLYTHHKDEPSYTLPLYLVTDGG